jgi:hypothetical protein
MVKPVDQTEYGDDSNWYSACLASILEIGISDIPKMSGLLDIEHTWFDRTQAWLLHRSMFAVVLNDDDRASGYYIAIGKNKKGEIHGVIYLDGALVHDPHPSKSGLVGDPDTRIMIKRINDGRKRKSA